MNEWLKLGRYRSTDEREREREREREIQRDTEREIQRERKEERKKERQLSVFQVKFFNGLTTL